MENEPIRSFWRAVRERRWEEALASFDQQAIEALDPLLKARILTKLIGINERGEDWDYEFELFNKMLIAGAPVNLEKFKMIPYEYYDTPADISCERKAIVIAQLGKQLALYGGVNNDFTKLWLPGEIQPYDLRPIGVIDFFKIPRLNKAHLDLFQVIFVVYRLDPNRQHGLRFCLIREAIKYSDSALLIEAISAVRWIDPDVIEPGCTISRLDLVQHELKRFSDTTTLQHPYPQKMQDELKEVMTLQNKNLKRILFVLQRPRDRRFLKQAFDNGLPANDVSDLVKYANQFV